MGGGVSGEGAAVVAGARRRERRERRGGVDIARKRISQPSSSVILSRCRHTSLTRSTYLRTAIIFSFFTFLSNPGAQSCAIDGMLATWLPAALPASYLLGYKGLFTRDGDLIRDLDKYVRSGQPCFSQLQNEVKNPFAYAKTRYGKEPKFVYHYTDNERSLEQDGDAKMGDCVYMTTIPEWASKKVILRNNYDGAALKDEYSRRAEAFIRIPFEDLDNYLAWADGEFQTDKRSVFCIGGARPLRLRWRRVAS